MNSSSNPAWSEKPSWEHPITPFDQSASATSPLSYLPHSQTGSTVTTSITADPPNRETTTTDKPGKSHFFHLFTFTPPRHVPLLILSIASSALCAAGRTGYVLFLGKLFELVALFGAGQLPPDVFLAQVSRWSVYLVVLGVGMWVASTLEIALWVAGGELRAKEVRERVWEVLMKKSLGWFEAKEEGGGAFVTKILTQTRELQTASSQTLGFLVYELFVFAACVAVAFFFSFKLTLVMLATGVPSALFLWVIGQFLDPAIDAQRRELAEAAKCATAAVTAIDIVKVYNAEGQEASRFVAAVKRSAKYYSRQVLCNCAQMSYVKLWMMMLFVLGFFYAVVLVSSGELTPGTALTTFYAALVAFQSLEATGPMWLVLVKGMAAGQSLQALVRDDCSGSGESSLRADKSTGWRKPSTCSGNILMNNISFAYPSNPANTVLRPSTLRFAAGQLTFVVGRSGSGKSTLGNLLVRFYEPLTGQITLDGNPIPTLDLEWLRRNVTLVQQSSVFFHDTFFQNVAFGASDPDNVSPQAVRDACSMALLQSTIAGLPDGLLTKVGSGDCNLSGGQKQRLALARAKLRDPPVLILDEITSGLDPVSRSLIMEAIRIWRKGKTTIIITHEVGQIEEDDYVYVLADGSIVQRGFGHELSKDESGLFASLVASADETCSLADSDISNSESESDCGIPWQEPTEERRFSGFLPRFSTGSRLSWGLFQGTEWRVEPVNARETFIGPRQAPKQGHPPSGMHIVTKAGLEVQSRRALHARQTREKILTQQHQASLDSLELFFLERLAERKDKTKSPKGPEPLSMLVVLKTVWPTLDFLGKGEFILGLLLCLVLASSTPIFAFLFANLLSAFWLPEARGAASVMWSVFLTVTAVAAAASTFFSYFFMEMVAQKWVNRLRAEAIQRILSQPKPWFDSASHSASNIAQCLDRNAEEMRKLVGTFLPILLSVSAMILGAIIWALVIRWDLTLVTLVGVPLALGTARANAMISDKWETNCDEAAASTGAIFSEAYSNVKVVRALTLERYFSDKHALSARSTFRLGLKRAAWVGTFFGLYNCISYFLTSLVFFYSAKILSEGLTTVTDVIRVNNLLLFTLGTAVVLLAHVPQIAAAKTTAKRMLYYANLSHVAGHETQGGMRLSTPFPVRMTNLRFAYPSAPDKLILRNINLRIDAGTFTALVGASGCGKSTITALLLRLYEPSQGDDESNTATTRPPAPVRTSPSYSRPLTFIPSPIPESPVSQKKTIPSPSSALTFASHPASSLSTRSLRAQLGYVPQTPFLFPASVFANLTYGLPENSPLRDEANVHLAARQAGIHDFIVSLPRGYDTPLGEGGQQVSGGQAQRLCIARALVRRPRLLILDEPTSALDAQSAEAIRRVVRDLVAAQRRRSGGGSQGGMIPTEEEDVDMAVVVVTHSKEMMRVADRVVMVEDGVIVESGGYEELVRKGGKFAGLVGGGMWAPGTADGKGKGRRMVGEEKVEAEVKRSREETLYKLEGF